MKAKSIVKAVEKHEKKEVKGKIKGIKEDKKMITTVKKMAKKIKK